MTERALGPEPVQAETRAYSVCVFCGSRFGQEPVFRQAAEEIGRLIARAQWRLVYGGGNVGLMGALAGAAKDAGGDVLGIIPRHLMEREVGRRDLDELQITTTMFERKERMIAASDAFIVLPGGYGTLDEFLEVVTLKQLGYHAKPIILLDVDGVWQSLSAAMNDVVARGFAEPSAGTLWRLERSVQDCFEALAADAATRMPAASAAT